MSINPYWKDRGKPWEYDAGPPKNLSWPRLFSETPNYRQLSKTCLGREKFRWHFGPMYYRGRLKPNSVKVVIIGHPYKETIDVLSEELPKLEKQGFVDLHQALIEQKQHLYRKAQKY